MDTGIINYTLVNKGDTGTPIPWLKVIGGALICWIREQHPELWESKKGD